MGCCASANKASEFDQLGSATLNPKSTRESRAPPPQSLEEETVKEVLSETPNAKPPPQQPININTLQDNANKNKIHHEPPLLPLPFVDQNATKNDVKPYHEDEISEQEVSEVCSVSLSESTINDGEEVKQRVIRSPAPRNRSFPGDRVGPKRDRHNGNSPIQRGGRSPVKRNNAGGGGTVRLVESKESLERRGLRSDPSRRDPGESSGRRSRSPSFNRSAMGRRTLAVRGNRSPGRVRKDPPENEMNKASVVEESSFATNESLENPLVSLECFIFL
ncbi:hypothetical protein K2173_004353 [Erythroxylum novogranatense]|uniref:Uncharacterized protein n=1 Tax=Erythroxylum novogranatense TaxID=1862640 RepID=A0AAV8T493_9ROSI|nr:hypothetical protein K2173_004353 [Erythroxylum novogranatense]